MAIQRPTPPNVGYVRQELADLLPRYTRIRDCLAGEDRVKSRAEAYLPRPNGDIKTPAMAARYREYLGRAVFYNVTRSTLNGLVGQVYAKPPIVRLPANMEHLLNDADGSGVSLLQQSKRALQMNIAFSRGGLHVDYPPNDQALTMSDIKTRNMRPTVNLYSAEEIVNWRLIEDGAEQKLALVVLYESYTCEDDGFELKFAPQYRVLRLDESGEYVQEIWREIGPPSQFDTYKYPTRKNFGKTSIFKPTDSSGQPFRELPFAFFGADNNDPNPDLPNLSDIADLNLAHYRNSADYEEQLFIMGQSTLFISGVDQEWQEKMGGKINFGSRSVILAGQGADAKLIQAEANGIHKEAMESKERQMVALGARLIEKKEVQRTAYEARSEDASKTSVLGTCTQNVNAAYMRALEFARRFSPVGTTGEIKFELNTDFEILKMDPERQARIVELWSKNALTFSEMRDVLVKAGTATIEDAEAAKKMVDEEAVEKQKKMMAAMEAYNPAFKNGSQSGQNQKDNNEDDQSA